MIVLKSIPRFECERRTAPLISQSRQWEQSAKQMGFHAQRIRLIAAAKLRAEQDNLVMLDVELGRHSHMSK